MVSSDQRRRQLAREKYERQQQRRAEARRKARRRAAVVGAAAAVVVATLVGLVAGGVFDGKDEKTEASSTPSPSASPTPKQSPLGDGDRRQGEVHLRPQDERGRRHVRDGRGEDPQTVNSFKSLADKGFFDNTKCHRLVTSGIFVLQCGDPQGTGMGGPGYTIPDENLDALGKPNAQGQVIYPAGTVAMANTGQPGTGGSQFFLVYKDSPLAPSYTPFGKIDAAGLKVVEDIAKAGTADGAQDGAPKNPVTIEKGTVTKN